MTKALVFIFLTFELLIFTGITQAETITYQISLTIPPHVQMPSNTADIGAAPLEQKNLPQLARDTRTSIQDQQVERNGSIVTIRSIVVL